MELTLRLHQSTQVLVTCDGVQSHTFDLAALIPADQHSQTLPHPLVDPVAYGKTIYAAMFPERSLARQKLDAAGRILWVADPGLQAIPWEYIHNGDNFLALEIPMVRGLPVEKRHPAPNINGATLHITAVPSNPIEHGLPPLNIAGEWQRLSEGVEGISSQVLLERVNPPTLDQLRERILPQKQAVVHFMGHGNQEGDQAVLCFENEHGGLQKITTKDFLLSVKRHVFLVTLNACVSATPGATEFSNLAHALVDAGIPYALGMRFSIPDADALTFGRVFYANLSGGSDVEEAVFQARRSIMRKTSHLWLVGVPVLYTSLSEPAAGFASQPGTPRVEEHQPWIDLVDLPRAPGAFQGRVNELLFLGKALTGEPRGKLLTIQGTGGQGKTALAREAGERFAHAWPGGVWGISLESRPSREYFCSRLGKFLGLPVDQIPNREDLERKILDRLNQRRTLIVLDNAETMIEGVRTKDPAARDLTTFLIERLYGTSASLLVTSREPLSWAGEKVLPLEGLSPVEGAALFIQSTPQRLNEIDMDSARSLSMRVEGHPLALILLGQTFNDISDTITKFLEGHQKYLLKAENRYKGVDHRHRTLYASIETSIRYLDEDLRRLLSGLWIFQGAFRPEDAADIFSPAAGKETEEQRENRQGGIAVQLQTLARRGLLVMEQETLSVGNILFYRVLPTVRLFLKNYLLQNWEEADLKSQMGKVYAVIVQWIYEEFDRSDMGAYLADWCREDILQCADWVEETGRGWYWNWLGWVLQRSGDRAGGLTWLGRALQLAQEQQDQALELVVRNNLGYIYQSTGNPKQALLLFGQALPIMRAVGNRAGEATTLNNIGEVFRIIGKPKKALKLYEQAMPIIRAVGDRAGEAVTLNNMGLVYWSTGQPKKALELYEQVLPIIRAVGNRLGEATTLNNMGLVYRSTGQPKKALELYEQALPIIRAVGNRSGEATSLNNMGVVYNSIGQPEHALELYEQALPILREVGDRAGEATTMNGMGAVYNSIGQPEHALELYEQALPILREVGNRSGEATTLNNMAFAMRDLRQDSNALSHLRQAVALEKQVHDPDYSEDAKTLALWEAAVHHGERLPEKEHVSSRLSQGELRMIAANIINVLTEVPERLDIWRGMITSNLQKAKQNAMSVDQAFFETILAILSGEEPAIPADNPYAGVVAEILESLHQFSPKQSAHLPVDFAARCAAGLKGGFAEKGALVNGLAQWVEKASAGDRALIDAVQQLIFGADISTLGQNLPEEQQKIWDEIVNSLNP